MSMALEQSHFGAHDGIFPSGLPIAIVEDQDSHGGGVQGRERGLRLVRQGAGSGSAFFREERIGMPVESKGARQSARRLKRHAQLGENGGSYSVSNLA